MTQREEIDVIYAEYAKTAGLMSPDNLVEFLMKEQREKSTLADAQKIIEKHEPDEKGEGPILEITFVYCFFFLVALFHLY